LREIFISLGCNRRRSNQLDPKKGLSSRQKKVASEDKREKIVLGPKWQNNSSRGAYGRMREMKKTTQVAKKKRNA